ncbi:EpsI family protein [Uliginosibacterium sp. H3]|uniref:EpsI family protein n=1 Tax=Uliginosibacterium silvisoli TaxID=3114758 RepID=A0ABU6JZW3_9RHOO|nr:EpsI family protein [Uliginosibacterium sp. H3]
MTEEFASQRRLVIKSIVMFACMASASVVSTTLKPTLRLSETRPKVRMADLVPKRFGSWTLDEFSGGAVVNPQAQEMLDIVYADVLSRVYVNARGQRIMLSVAYGTTQTDALQVHKPEICYPAQGFRLLSSKASPLQTPFGDIPVRRLETAMGERRYEPVSYWTTIGDHAVKNELDKKIQEMEYAAKGYIADGLLFRVSSIDRDSAAAFVLHEQFIYEMLQAIPQAARLRLAGLSN